MSYLVPAIVIVAAIAATAFLAWIALAIVAVWLEIRAARDPGDGFEGSSKLQDVGR